MAQKRYVRVMEPAGPGLVKQAPEVVDRQTGQTMTYPITDTNIYTEAQAKAAGFVCKSNNSKQAIPQQMMNMNQPYGVLPAEKVNGMPSVVRSEVPDPTSGSNTITLTISNGHTSPEQLLLGDGFGILAQVYNIPAKNAATTIGGTFQTETLTRYAAITSGSALRLHGVHLVNTTTAGAESTGFFDNGKMELLYGSPTNNSSVKNRFDLQQLVNSNSFKPNIRESKDFRFLLDGYAAVLFTVPNGEAITVTFNLQSFANGHLMNKDLNL